MSTTVELIKRLRDEFGLSQTEISKRTSIPQPRLSKWEREAPATADDSLKLLRLVQQMEAPQPEPQQAGEVGNA